MLDVARYARIFYVLKKRTNNVIKFRTHLNNKKDEKLFVLILNFYNPLFVFFLQNVLYHSTVNYNSCFPHRVRHKW